MKRFVILSHDWPTPHYDLLIEAEGVLRAWRLPTPPEPGREVEAQANADHRMVYLDFEGPLTGDRGSVAAWDRGTYTGDLAGPLLCLQVLGFRLRGQLWLEAVSTETWQVTFVPSTDVACSMPAE